ncbi:MAG: hypothetical protein MUO27_04795 [Sedimentisphaerales bacterium]|nr:hypothetical protein [Sedimentisphaerales bacterium]
MVNHCFGQRREIRVSAGKKFTLSKVEGPLAVGDTIARQTRNGHSHPLGGEMTAASMPPRLTNSVKIRAIRG